MPRATIAQNEYYHIYNRGFEKRNIFLDKSDYARMLFNVLFFQSPVTFNDISELTEHFLKSGDFGVTNKKINRIVDNKSVDLAAYVLMPNHFHLIVGEIEEGGIAKYLMRLEAGYTKYFNIKNKRFGYLFQGPYQAVHLKTNEQLLHLSAYIHRNPRDLIKWRNREDKYPWSSYKDYIMGNMWRGLLDRDEALRQFKTPELYRDFVETSNTKNLDKDGLFED